MKNNIKIIIILSFVIVTIIAVGILEYKKTNKAVTVEEKKVSQILIQPSDEEINGELDTLLEVLMSIHYISLIDKTAETPETLIMTELQESMNDLNKLKGLLYQTESLSNSKNEIISVSGKTLHVSILKLIDIYNAWIIYLRGVDINNLDIAEFQYQISLFGTSTHDVYLNLAKGVSLVPMVSVEFAKEGGENVINQELKDHFLGKIDELFSDILIADDLSYKEKKIRYAIPVVVRGYKNFFSEK